VLDIVLLGLFPAELDLRIPRLAPTSTLLHLREGHLFAVCTPGVREDGVRWDIIYEIFGQADLARTAPFQEPHRTIIVDEALQA